MSVPALLAKRVQQALFFCLFWFLHFIFGVASFLVLQFDNGRMDWWFYDDLCLPNWRRKREPHLTSLDPKIGDWCVRTQGFYDLFFHALFLYIFLTTQSVLFQNDYVFIFWMYLPIYHSPISSYLHTLWPMAILFYLLIEKSIPLYFFRRVLQRHDMLTRIWYNDRKYQNPSSWVKSSLFYVENRK